MYIECGMGIPPLAPARALYQILSGGWVYTISGWRLRVAWVNKQVKRKQESLLVYEGSM